jgi:hypothetical protein
MAVLPVIAKLSGERGSFRRQPIWKALEVMNEPSKRETTKQRYSATSEDE